MQQLELMTISLNTRTIAGSEFSLGNDFVTKDKGPDPVVGGGVTDRGRGEGIVEAAGGRPLGGRLTGTTIRHPEITEDMVLLIRNAWAEARLVAD
jgi:hypothetical protein